MTAQILPVESSGLTQVQNSLRVSQTFATRLGNATYENFVGQYVLRPNLTRHWLALVERKKEYSDLKEKCRVPPAGDNYAAASSELNSMCMRSYGRTILFSSRLSTPPESKALTSLYTPRKSRLTIRASSRIDIPSFPSIALIICQRLGVSIVLANCSTVGNIRLVPIKSPLIARAASDAASRKATSTGITFTVINLIASPPQLLDISPEAAYQVFYSSEGYRVFPFTNMLVVALAPFVVVTHNAHFIDDIGEAVLVVVQTAFYWWHNLQNADCRKSILSNLNPCIHQLNGGHRLPLLIDVNNNINKGVMKAITSKKSYSELPNGRKKQGSNAAPLFVNLPGSFLAVVYVFGLVSFCFGYLVFLRRLSRNFNRHASITHAEKFRDFSSSSAAAICSSILYEKRIFFVAVLLVFGFFGMATPRVVWCSVDNFRQGEVNVIDLYQDNLSELTQTEAVKKHLRTDGGLGYVNPAPYKTGAGIGTPKLTKATPDAESVFFVVCYTRHFMAWCAIHPQGLRCRLAGLLTHHAAHNGAVRVSYAGFSPFFPVSNSTSRRRIMVALAGQPQGWPVPFVPGSSNPVNVTAPIEIGTSSGDSLTRTKEAA